MRQQAAHRFAAGETIRQIAQGLNVSYEAVRVWRRQWEQGGEEALVSRPPRGRKPQLSEAQLQRLEAELVKGPGHHGYRTQLWTLERIAKLIQKLFGVSHHPSHVFKLLRAMGWSCQKPERRARERDEEAIAHWVRERWPQIKKGHCRQARP